MLLLMVGETLISVPIPNQSGFIRLADGLSAPHYIQLRVLQPLRVEYDVALAKPSWPPRTQ